MLDSTDIGNYPLMKMEDKDIKTVDVEAIQANITTITQGLHMAADGYEQLNEKLSTVPPERVISLVEQVPLPSLEPTHPGITTALKQDGHHHILQLLVQDALEQKKWTQKEIQVKYQVLRDFIHEVKTGQKRAGGTQTRKAKQK